VTSRIDRTPGEAGALEKWLLPFLPEEAGLAEMIAIRILSNHENRSRVNRLLEL
jgi:hypothetical protein